MRLIFGKLKLHLKRVGPFLDKPITRIDPLREPGDHVHLQMEQSKWQTGSTQADPSELKSICGQVQTGPTWGNQPHQGKTCSDRIWTGFLIDLCPDQTGLKSSRSTSNRVTDVTSRFNDII